MDSHIKPIRRVAALSIALVAGAAAAVTVAGAAAAGTPTLQIARNAAVTDTAGKTTQRTIVANARGRAVYLLSGDSRSHPKCTKANGCWGFWPPVTAPAHGAATTAAGIHGTLTRWRHDGLTQLVLAGHPLYTFSRDTKRDTATGEGLVGFHGTWHVMGPSGGAAPAGRSLSPSPTTTPTTSTPTATMPPPCLYPPCY